jgi:hypothetical protein
MQGCGVERHELRPVADALLKIADELDALDTARDDEGDG